MELLEIWPCLALMDCMVITCMFTLQLPIQMFSNFYAFLVYLFYINNFKKKFNVNQMYLIRNAFYP